MLYCQFLIDYETPSHSKNFFINEKFWEVAETGTGSQK